MGPLLDTDVLSEFFKRRNANVREHAERYLKDHDAFSFSVITKYEILKGLRKIDATTQIARFEQLCQVARVLPLSDAVIKRAAGIWGELARAGTPIGDPDILIAATALASHLALVTGNVRHFQRIPDLEVVTWE